MKREFSFIIIPPSSKRPWVKKVSMKGVRILITAACIVIAGLVWLLYYSFRIPEYYYLKVENQKLRQKIAKLGEIENRITYIDKEGMKIKRMLGIEKSPPPVDFTKAVFSYQPAEPESISEDSTQEAPFRLSILPTTGFIVTRKFSPEHPGIDLATEEGNPAFASAGGVVKKVGFNSVFGNFLIIKHNKDYETFYGHLIRTAKNEKDSVKPGDIVGFIGTSGRATGPHLHFEVIYKGKKIDPKGFFMLK